MHVFKKHLKELLFSVWLIVGTWAGGTRCWRVVWSRFVFVDVCDRFCWVLISLGKQAPLASGARCLDVVSLLLFLSFLLPPSSLFLVELAAAVCGLLLLLFLLLLLVLGV